METVGVIIISVTLDLTIRFEFRKDLKPSSVDLIAEGSANFLQLIRRFFGKDIGETFTHRANIHPKPIWIHHQKCESCSFRDHVLGEDVGVVGKDYIDHLIGAEETEILVCRTVQNHVESVFIWMGTDASRLLIIHHMKFSSIHKCVGEFVENLAVSHDG